MALRFPPRFSQSAAHQWMKGSISAAPRHVTTAVATAGAVVLRLVQSVWRHVEPALRFVRSALRYVEPALRYPKLAWRHVEPALRRVTPAIMIVYSTLRRRSIVTWFLAAALSLLLAGSVSATPTNTPEDAARRSSATSGEDRGGSRAMPGRGQGTDKSGKKTKGKRSSASPSAPVVEPSPMPPSPPPSPAAPQLILTQPERPLENLGTTKVALTFDDGPDAATPEILALLRQHGVKATFCVIGTSVRSHHDAIRQIVAEGHSLCNHTWDHNLNLGKRSPDAIRADLQRTSDEIHRAVPGVPIKYFRHPGGNFTPAAIGIATELGMVSIGWDVDPRDWDIRNNGTGPSMGQHVINVVTSRTRPGSIILSHDGGGKRTGTTYAYRTLLPWLLARYELIALPV